MRLRPRRALALLVAAAVLLLPGRATPTTVIAPTFDEMVARAELVVLAQVVALRSVWTESRSGRTIVTDVTVSIDRTLKGPVFVQRSLEFLGGTVGDDTLQVSGMPEFHVGDRDVLFISDSGRPASPLVGFAYGRFRVVRDSATGVERIRTHDGRPLASTNEVGNPKPPAFALSTRALSLDEFLSAIDSKVSAERQR
jgi:hypothetical protein